LVLSEGQVIFWEYGKWGGSGPVTIFDSPVRSTEPSTVERFPLALFAFPIFRSAQGPRWPQRNFQGWNGGKAWECSRFFMRLKPMKAKTYQ